MATMIRGTYRNGKIELIEDPKISGESAVVVTFLESASEPVNGNKQLMSFGMLAATGRQMSTLEDFDSEQNADSRWDW